MIKYIIFDFDGTLVDTREVFVSAWNTIADEHHYKRIDPSQLEKIKNMSIKERSEFLHFPLYKLPLVIPKVLKLYKSVNKEIKFFDGIEDMLHMLINKGYKIVILSSNSEENIITCLKTNIMNKIITEVFSSSRIFGKDKAIRKLLKNKNLQPYEVIYVGDEHRDIVACNNCNVKVIWVEWGYDGREVIKSASPDYIVQKPEDILDLI